MRKLKAFFKELYVSFHTFTYSSTHSFGTPKKVSYLTLLTVSVGAVDPEVGLRFRGLPGPRRAGLLEVSSFL